MELNLNNELHKCVVEIIADKLSVSESEVTATASFQTDLGADSIDLVELIMGFESTFHISIPDSDAEKILTVSDAITHLEKAGAQAPKK